QWRLPGADRLLRAARRRAAVAAWPGRPARWRSAAACRRPRQRGRDTRRAGGRTVTGPGRRCHPRGSVWRGCGRVTGWRLLLTRPAAECAALAATLAEAGVFSRSLPLLETEALAQTPEQGTIMRELERYCVIVVVSKSAARLGLELLGRNRAAPPPGVHWFSVGAATAQVLDGYLQAHGLRAGFPCAGDDSEALLALPQFTAALQVPSPRALIIRGEGGRELIADTLRQRGVAVDYLQLYRRVRPQYPD